MFIDDRDRLRFEYLLASVVDRHRAELHAYCLMTNHFHLVLHFPAGGVSATMHDLSGKYARWFNDRYGRDGPLFARRFHSVGVTTDEQLMQVSRYVHRNPGVIVPVRALAAYRWSSFGAYAGTRPRPTWLRCGRVLDLFGGDRARYRGFVEDDQSCDRRSRERGVPDPKVAVADLERAAAAAGGVGTESLRNNGRGRPNAPRMAAVMLGLELRVATSDELASHFGFSSASSVRTLARRGRALECTDPSFGRFCERIRTSLRER